MNIKLQLMWVACVMVLPSMAQTNQEPTTTNPENFEITYNYLNLPCEIRDNAGNMISRYTYSSDGVKRAVVDSNGNGKYYAGPFVYNVEDGEIASLESVASAGGRTYKTDSGYEVRYFITDHLGSVRAVVNADGEVVEQNDYMPYGTLHANSALQKSDNHYLYGGKELQTDFGVNYYDSFARFQRTDGAFNSIDPLAEKYYSMSPYAYCAGNPVNLVDPDGKKPRIYIQGGGLGHVFLSVGDGPNLTIYSYGRYGALHSSSSSTCGYLTPRGEGVMRKYTGKDAMDFLAKNQHSIDAIYEINSDTDKSIMKYYDDQLDPNRRPSNPDKDTFNDENAYVIDDYNLFNNNCVTTTLKGINAAQGYIESDAITPNGLNDDLKQIVKEEGSNIIELPSLEQIIKINNYEN